MSYESDIQDWTNQFRTAIREDVKQLTKDTQANIVLKTAIDTGRARSSWNINPGLSADLSVTPPLAVRPHFGIIAVPQGVAPLTKGQAFTAAFGQHHNLERLTEPVATISNNLDYILGLENGTGSRQFAPGEMFSNNVFAALDEAEKLGYNATLTL